MGAGMRTRGQKRTRRKTTRYDGTPATMDGCASSKGKRSSVVRSGKGGDANDGDGGKRKRGRPRKGEGVVTNPVRVIFFVS